MEGAIKQELLDAIRAELAQRPVDLRPLFPVAQEFGPAILKAAKVWKMQPERVIAYYE